jgi:hypothetical protein
MQLFIAPMNLLNIHFHKLLVFVVSREFINQE